MSFNVRHSLFTQTGEHELLHLFDDNAYGLPNNSFCDHNGLPSSACLELAMGLNRRTRRGITKISCKPFIENHSIAQIRLVHYINKTSSAITNGAVILSTGDINGSWEAIVFTRFINRFHLSGSGCQESFNSINENDRDLLKKIFIGRYDDLVRHKSSRSTETLKLSSTKYPTPKEVENTFEVSAGLFLMRLTRGQCYRVRRY